MKDYLELYRRLHDCEDPYLFKDKRIAADTAGRLFNGQDFERSMIAHVRRWVFSRESSRVLDYGSGKARFLHQPTIHGKSLYEDFGGRLQSWYCYDPGYRAFMHPPTEEFDAVVCCDVFEHIPECDIDNVVAEMQGWMAEDAVAFINIGGNPSRIHFHDGENTHITVKPAEFWLEKVKNLNRPFVMRHVGNGIITKYVTRGMNE